MSDTLPACGPAPAAPVTGRVAVLADAGFRRVPLQPHWRRPIPCQRCGRPLNQHLVVYVIGGARLCFRCLPGRAGTGAA